MNTHLKNVILGTVAGILIAIVLFTPAMAQSNRDEQCFDRAILLPLLATEEFQQQRHAVMTSGKSLVEIYANIRSGEWVLLISEDTKTSCIMLAGGDFINLALGDLL